MLLSVIGSIQIFILFSVITASIWNKGYDLNKLGEISQQTIATITQQKAVDIKEIQPLLDHIHSSHPAIDFEWVTSEGTKIYATSGDLQPYDFQRLLELSVNMPQNLWAQNEPLTFIYKVTHNHMPYYLLMRLNSDVMKQGQVYFFIRSSTVLFLLLFPLLVSFLVPYLLSIWFFFSINRRIQTLNDALNQVNIQRDVLVLKDDSTDEIGQLTQHYNSMAQRIQHQVAEIEQFENRRTQLLANLSHDLRTPLTMILGYAETIRNGLYKDEKALQASAKIILQRSRYMDRLLEQLLDISRQNTETLTPQFATHNVSEMVRKIVADYLLLLDGQHYLLDIDIADDDVEAVIDAALIERALRNLIDNAIRYGKAGHYLGILLEERQSEVWITIKDKGTGIALEEQAQIFERFYRVNPGRNGEGLGIGLSIVKEITTLHQGTIQVTSIPHEETIFRMQLPKIR